MFYSIFKNKFNKIFRLEQSRQQLEHLALLGELSANLIHEINTPLGIISLSSSDLKEVILNGDLDTEYILNSLDDIEACSYKIKDIATTFKKYAFNTEQTNFSFTSVKKIISDLELLCSSSLKKHQINLSLIIECPELHIEVMSVGVVQVLLNLVKNSQDEISETNNPWIELKVYSENEKIIFCVRDSGEFKNIQSPNKIFNRKISSKLENGGSGFGLYFSKEMAKKHRGTIELIEFEGHPSFCMCLPILQDLKEAI